MGLFIVLEGCEGSGKTSVLKEVFQRLLADKYDVICTREPGGTKIAEQIRQIILDKDNKEMDSRTEALLYAASRRQHLIEKVIPALKNNQIVLCDRFLDSSLAYQGFARNIGIENVYAMNLFALDGCLPDYTLFFDINPRDSLIRISKNINREVNRLDLEILSFHESVYQGYRQIQKQYPERKFINIDATLSFEEVVENCYQTIVDLIHKHHNE